MRAVANRLEHLGCINRDIRLAITFGGPAGPSPMSDRLVLLRADFGFECSQLMNQLTGKLSMNDHAQLASRILASFVSMQQLLTRHQQSWPSVEVERNAGGYIDASLKVHAGVIDFLEGALEAVETAARPARNAPPVISPFAQSASVRLTGTR